MSKSKMEQVSTIKPRRTLHWMPHMFNRLTGCTTRYAHRFGFGEAYVMKDGVIYCDCEDYNDQTGAFILVSDVEMVAQNDPNHDWRIVKNAPLHGETFQRHGKEKWVCIESNPGFA